MHKPTKAKYVTINAQTHEGEVYHYLMHRPTKAKYVTINAQTHEGEVCH